MKDAATGSAGEGLSRSPSVEKALRELAQTPLTEACLSGLCDICLHQPDLCEIVPEQREDSHLSGQPAE